MQEAYVNGYWDEIVGFMRNLFNTTFKSNQYLYKALFTGITRVSRESLFSDLNNIKVVTTSSEQYADCFGFIEEEVFKVLDKYGYGKEKENVKKWYDGFKFGKVEDIYNPWSVLSFLQEGKYEPYWLNGDTIKTTIDEQLVFGEMSKNKNAVWSLLHSTGYLKAVETRMSEGIVEYSLKITNYEVKACFNLLVLRWFENAGENYSFFVKALLDGNVGEMMDTLTEICESMISVFDGSGKSAPENFYHGLVLGLLVELRESYEIRSNRESGLGRYDVMLSKNMRMFFNAPIYEIHLPLKHPKYILEDKKYETELLNAGYAKERIKKFAFVFEGKELLIKD